MRLETSDLNRMDNLGDQERQIYYALYQLPMADRSMREKAGFSVTYSGVADVIDLVSGVEAHGTLYNQTVQHMIKKLKKDIFE